MNKLFNLHTHCHFCDGKAEPEAYVTEAITQGFHTLGFSSRQTAKIQGGLGYLFVLQYPGASQYQ